MFDLIPWLDETYIVEMGRLFLSGGDANSTLMGSSPVSLMPFCYLGPLLQEVLFRLGGQLAVRLSPFVGLMVMAVSFGVYLKRTTTLPRLERRVFALAVLVSPIAFQCALLTRVDTWALAAIWCALAALACPEGRLRTKTTLAVAAGFSVVAVFVWPTAFLFGPLVVAAFSWSRRREFAWFCGFSAIFMILLLIPIATRLDVFVAAFSRHYQEVAAPTPTVVSGILAVAREIARDPLLSVLVGYGVWRWLIERRWGLLAAMLASVAVAIHAGLYVFRLAYLLPFAFLATVRAVVSLRARHACWARRAVFTLAAYGLLTGPIGHFALTYQTLPKDLTQTLAETIGRGPIRVFAPDHATYYIGRELGWIQLGFARPNEAENPELLSRVLADCDYVVLRDFDPYTPFQQSCTPYGLFCRYVLQKTKAERNLPDTQKSWAARFGGRFSFAWHRPLRFEGFEECCRQEPIRVLKCTRYANGAILYDCKSD